MLNRRVLLAGLLAFGAAPARAAVGKKPLVIVEKDPSCGCCNAWVEHLRAAGFPVRVIENDRLEPVKKARGIPRDLWSCHTAVVDGYVIEGHVPAAEIERLLADRPKAVGLAVPGMPIGSPGMEVANMAPEAYEVVAFGPSGTTPFARYLGDKPV
ncbi:DUF411 domain-containing protein [Prosthecomicrobium sp. N25]|uniref:DUF411 domain-containing protein n=1 Tax=Prosthecomicrobium sp. N25 TaxID=3129254 RepID=UPI0030774149